MIRLNDTPERICHTDVFRELANYFRVQDGNVISIPSPIGSGTIQQIELDQGLHVRCWDISLCHPVNITKTIALPGTGRTFNLTYLLTPDRFCMEVPGPANNIKLKGGMHLLFDSGSHPLSYHLQPVNGAKAIVISLTTEWLMAEFNMNNSFHEFVRRMIGRESASIFYESIPDLHEQLLLDFHNHLVSGSADILYIRTKALSLLMEFLYGAFLRSPVEAEQASILYHDKIKEVENKLREHLHGQLPSIRTLAREAAMSESTLKRYFHLIYDASIYEYYLQLKMEHGRELLKTKKMPVKEVAYALGYEKCSSFIRMFRKYYKDSPGLFRERHWLSGLLLLGAACAGHGMFI